MCIQLTKPVVEGKIKGKYDILQWAKVDLWIASLDWAPVGASDQRTFTSSHQCSWRVIHGYNIYIYTHGITTKYRKLHPTFIHISECIYMHINIYDGNLRPHPGSPRSFQSGHPPGCFTLSSLDVLPQGVIALRQGAVGTFLLPDGSLGWSWAATWGNGKQETNKGATIYAASRQPMFEYTNSVGPLIWTSRPIQVRFCLPLMGI